MFEEKSRRHRMNRRLAKDIRARPAVLADGTHGVVIRYGGDLLVLSSTEAVQLSNLLVDTVEAHEPRVSPPDQSAHQIG